MFIYFKLCIDVFQLISDDIYIFCKIQQLLNRIFSLRHLNLPFSVDLYSNMTMLWLIFPPQISCTPVLMRGYWYAYFTGRDTFIWKIKGCLTDRLYLTLDMMNLNAEVKTVKGKPDILNIYKLHLIVIMTGLGTYMYCL